MRSTLYIKVVTEISPLLVFPSGISVGATFPKTTKWLPISHSSNYHIHITKCEFTNLLRLERRCKKQIEMVPDFMSDCRQSCIFKRKVCKEPINPVVSLFYRHYIHLLHYDALKQKLVYCHF